MANVSALAAMHFHRSPSDKFTEWEDLEGYGLLKAAASNFVLKEWHEIGSIFLDLATLLHPRNANARNIAEIIH
jgi:hypothetical protein